MRYLNLASVLPALCVEKQPWHRQEAEHCSAKQDELQDVFFLALKKFYTVPAENMNHLKCILYFERFSALHYSRTGLSFGTTFPQPFNAPHGV